MVNNEHDHGFNHEIGGGQKQETGLFCVRVCVCVFDCFQLLPCQLYMFALWEISYVIMHLIFTIMKNLWNALLVFGFIAFELVIHLRHQGMQILLHAL